MSSVPSMAVLRMEAMTIIRRRSGLAALCTSLAVGVIAVLAMATTEDMATSGSVTVQGANIGQFVTVSGPEAAAWALRMRNFFVLPMLMLLATGGAISGELTDHTMRERLVRAVPRWSLLTTKIMALMLLSGATLVVTFVPAILGGMLLFGVDGSWTDLLLGYAASWLSDLGIVALGTLLSTLFRAPGGVVVGGLMVLLADWAVRMLLTFLSFVGLQGSADLLPWLPGSALGCWQGMSTGWTVQPFLGLVVLIAVCLGIALARFSRMVIP